MAHADSRQLDASHADATLVRASGTIAAGTRAQPHRGSAAESAPMQQGGDDAPLNTPAGPFQNLFGLAASSGGASMSSGGAAPGGIAWLGVLALGIVFLMRLNRRPTGSSLPTSPSYSLDCTPD